MNSVKKNTRLGATRAHRGSAHIMIIASAIAGAFLAGPVLAADITACGTTINTAGFYRVAQNLTASKGDCIDVNAPHTIVFLNGKKISGTGSGVGIKVSSRATHSFVEGANATVTGFAVGIEDDASYFRADNFNANSNSSGGVLLNHAQSSTLSNFQTSNNGSYGVHFLESSNSVAESAQATSNGAYGIWLDGAKGARVDNFDAEQNLTAGIYIGCSSKGPGSACAGGTHISSSNQVYDGFANGNGPYGVAIDTNSTANLVTSVEAMNNKTTDMLDLSHCASGSWFGNAFSNATPSNCIN